MQSSQPDGSVNRRGARTSSLVIVALWVLSLADSARTAVTERPEEFTKGMPPWFGLVGVLLPLVFFPLASTWGKSSPLLHPGLSRWIDSRAGKGATADFLRRWQPLLMFGAAGAVHSLVLGVRLAAAGTATHEWWAVGFICSLAASFTLSHVILKRRGVPGV